MSELAKRWVVAGVGIPLVVLILYGGGWPLAVPVAGLAALGAREVYGIAAVRGIIPVAPLGMLMALALVFCAAWRPTFTGYAPLALGVLGLGTLATMVIALRARGPEGYPLEAIAVTLLGAMYTGLALSFVLLIYDMPYDWVIQAPPVPRFRSEWHGVLLVALPLAATWLGDALAFFAGRAWGKGGLAPTISPKKSWVGAWAGVGGAALAGLTWFFIAAAVIEDLPMARLVGGPVVALLVGMLLGVAAIVGDLVESLLKRQAGVKDSGAVFPGHGGVLDRLDALIFTLPTAYIALAVVEALAGGSP